MQVILQKMSDFFNKITKIQKISAWPRLTFGGILLTGFQKGQQNTPLTGPLRLVNGVQY